MNKSSIALVIVVIVLGGLNVFQYYQYTQLSEYMRSLEESLSSLEESYPRLISELKGPERDSFLGETVTVEGYFVVVAGKHPMLVSSLDLLAMNRRIPDDQLLVLTGDVAEELLEEIGAMVHVKGTAVEMEEDVWLDFKGYNVVYEMATPLQKGLEPIMIEAPLRMVYHKYAVLISGGITSKLAYHRYWNDMKYMYSILINSYNYRPDHVYVIYKDGVGEDTDMPVNYSATTANVQSVFNELATRMTVDDTLFVFANNHGGGFDPFDTLWKVYNYGLIDADGDEPEAGYSEATYNTDFNMDGDKLDTVKIDETLCLYYNQEISDDALDNMLDNIQYSQMIIFMEQCFSGGFIHDLSGPNRIILTACGEEEPSWGADDKPKKEGNYNEFSYHFMRAVKGEDWSADANNDWNISMVEAFNYASKQDSQNETPHYDDNGDQVGHTEPVPNGGDGATGSNAFL